jgi:hypothetical protein
VRIDFVVSKATGLGWGFAELGAGRSGELTLSKVDMAYFNLGCRFELLIRMYY